MQLPADTSWLRRDETRALLAALQQSGLEVRFVGGCVRDALMGRCAGDIDLATPAMPEEILERLSARGLRVLPTGLKHGTVMVVINARHFEITTLRRDVACDGRHAEVAFTRQWQEDAGRRDFTVNALYADSAGMLYDYHGGVRDLAAKRLRFIGDGRTRLVEDALRILRYFRFQAQLGFHGDAEALAACASEAQRITRLSGERIRQEMLKLLAAPHLTPALLEDMARAGAIQVLCNAHRLRDARPLLAAEAKSAMGALPFVRLAWFIPPGQAAWLCERWRFSSTETSQVNLLMDAANRLTPAASPADQKKLLRRLGKEHFSECVLLSWAEAIEASPEAPHDAAFLPMLALAREWEVPVFPLTGKNMLEAGLAPGPAVGEALTRLERAWEESGYTLTKEVLLQFL